MAGPQAVRLFDVEPDLARFLTADEQAEARRIAVPAQVFAKSQEDVTMALAEAGAFGALVLEGMFLQSLTLGEHTAMRLLGPGDVISRGATRSMLLADAPVRAAASSKVAMLGNEVLLAARRWPRIVAGLHVRMAEQSERQAAHLVICQLPRVEERLLAFLWLLAESWGQVTASGTVLPLSLTHDALGALIGARRPTVTLALGELSERGAIVRQDRGWLLLEAVEEPAGTTRKIEEPALLELEPSPWSAPAEPGPVGASSIDILRETVAALRERHRHDVESYRQRLERIRATRERVVRRARRRGVG